MRLDHTKPLAACLPFVKRLKRARRIVDASRSDEIAASLFDRRVVIDGSTAVGDSVCRGEAGRPKEEGNDFS